MTANLIAPTGPVRTRRPTDNPTARSDVTIRRHDGNLDDLGPESWRRFETILNGSTAGCVYMNPTVSVRATAWNDQFFREAVKAHRAWYHWLRQVFGRRSGRNAAKNQSSEDRFWLPGILWIGEAFEPISILDSPAPVGPDSHVQYHPVDWDALKGGNFTSTLKPFQERLRLLRDIKKVTCCYLTPGFTLVCDRPGPDFFGTLKKRQADWQKRCRWQLEEQFQPLKRAAVSQTRQLIFDGIVILEPESILARTAAEDDFTRVKTLSHARIGGWEQIRDFLDTGSFANASDLAEVTLASPGI